MTKDRLQEHIDNVGGGPRTDEEIARLERMYQANIAEGRAELNAAEFEARRPPGAAPLSRFAGLRASMPSFVNDIAALPEVPPVPETPIVNGNGNGHNPPLDVEMLRALGNMFVDVKHESGPARAWEQVVEALMKNLYRLVPGYGTLKDVVALARSLDEYSNPVTGNDRKKGGVKEWRSKLMLDEE